MSAPTARDVVKLAMQDRKVLSLGEQPEAEELAYGLGVLDDMLAEWSARAVLPWSEQRREFAWPAGTERMDLMDDVEAVTDVAVVIGSHERPCWRREPDEYAIRLARSGEPLMYVEEEAVDGTVLRLWPVPNRDVVVRYRFARRIAAAEASAPLDLPAAWRTAVRKGLASRLDTFGDGGDPSNLAKLMQEAAIAERAVFDRARPASYRLMPGA